MNDVPEPGEVLGGKIELLRLLGRGGMGAVYEARHAGTGRKVAVKVLRAEAAGDTDAIARLLQEALACGRIRHPNVVDVLDAASDRGRPYVVMELLEGESLAQRIERAGPLPVAETLDLFTDVLDGVAAAHAAGIVHRDLKPDNLFLSRRHDGATVVKVLDFGIAKASDVDSFAKTALSLTGTGMVLGTPYYMSPEQARGRKDTDARSDVYSLGAVLFHMLTGRPPFLADNYNSLIAQILLDEPPSLDELRPELPASLGTLVRTAMAKKPDERFPTATAFRDRVARQTRLLPDATILFTDLERFNTFSLAAPVEIVEELLESWERAHRDACARHGGVLRLVVGDEMLSTFPSPAAAVRAWRELSDLDRYPPHVREHVRFKAGLSRGDVRIVRSAIVGEALPLGARLTSRGVAGELAMLPAEHAGLPDDLRAELEVRPSEEPVGPSADLTASIARLRSGVWVRPR